MIISHLDGNTHRVFIWIWTDHVQPHDLSCDQRKLSIPESVRDTFAAIQCANPDLKKQKASAVIAGAAAGAAAISAVPIPFLDAALLVPEKIGMMAGTVIRKTVQGLPQMEAPVVTADESYQAGRGFSIPFEPVEGATSYSSFLYRLNWNLSIEQLL